MDISELMQKAGAMQAVMKDMQEKIAGLEATGEAGAGMVKVTINGRGYATTASIEKSLLKEDEGEILEDLIVAAINDARSKMEAKSAEKVKGMKDGLSLPPGFNLPF